MTDHGPSDPERIRSIAVHREDVATALEATRRSDRDVVLRVTPPFSGRMRARIHAGGSDAGESSDAKAGVKADGSSSTGEGTQRDVGSGSDPEPIRIDPEDLVADVPAYPEVDETANEHPDADVETRRQRHAEAVDAWRERVRRSIVGSVVLAIGGDPAHEVNVNALG